jgi:hypothetical protein
LQIFKLGKIAGSEYQAVCRSEGTRSGFRHLASLFRDGSEIASTKICYINRTWEAYQFASVLQNLINRSGLEDKVKAKLQAKVSGRRF